MADEAMRLQTLPVLFYYNLIFVLPLLMITALLYFGSFHVEWMRGWQEKNKPLLLKALVFACIRILMFRLV